MNRNEMNSITTVTIRELGRISTSQRLKELILESGLNNKEFVHQFNEWLHKKQIEGLYNEQPDIKEEYLSRWTKPKADGKVVGMRTDKIKMFADYFHVDFEYLECTQVEKKKRNAKKEKNHQDIIDDIKEEYNIINHLKEFLWDHEINLYDADYSSKTETERFIENGILYEFKRLVETDINAYEIYCSEHDIVTLTSDQLNCFTEDLIRYAKFLIGEIKNNNSQLQTDIIKSKRKRGETTQKTDPENNKAGSKKPVDKKRK